MSRFTRTRTHRRTTVGGVLALAILLLPAGTASAATQVGQTFVPDENFGPNYTTLQSVAPGNQYTVPTAGVITSWQFQAAATNVPVGMKLKVGRPLGGNSFTIVGESPAKNPVASTLNTYTDVAIPVQPGDVIGQYTGSVLSFNSQDPGCTTACMESELEADVPTGVPSLFDGPFEGYLLDIAATIEPDCDGDGLGDETQDADAPCAGIVPPDSTITLAAGKSKVKKGKEVVFSGQLTASGDQAAACQSGQIVQLQRSKPGKNDFSTVEQVPTSAAGDYSADLKAKKTAEYRAQVAPSGSCAQATSDVLKVKVKKPK